MVEGSRDLSIRTDAIRPHRARRGVWSIRRAGTWIEGLIPLSETGIPRDQDIKKAFPVGNDLEVVILDVDGAARRIRLSSKAVEKAKEADEVREYEEQRGDAPSEKFGSLADKLRGALKPRGSDR